MVVAGSGKLSDRDDQQLRAIFDCAPDAGIIADDQGRLVEATPAGRELLGLTAGQLGQRTLADLAAPGSDVAGAWAALLANGRAAADLVVAPAGGPRRVVELRGT